jgi:hypothetical protein
LLASMLHRGRARGDRLMPYQVLLVLIFLAILMLAGLVLIVDAVRRRIRELRESNRDLHA